MQTIKYKQAFTLIELLVVVLIIGILAAVALPQYQVAVEKSRLATVMGNVKTIRDAADLYYLANGKYVDDATVLDIDVSGCTSYPEGPLGGVIDCEKNGWYDWITAGGGYAANGYTRPRGEFKNAYVLFGKYSSTPSVAECYAVQDDTVANRVCKSLGGVPNRSRSCPTTSLSCQVYRLPN